MNLSSQRRIAAEILDVGENRVYINPEKYKQVSEAITREDIRNLIKEGIIYAKPINGTSRARARYIQEQKSKGRRKGPGRRKGSSNARYPKKKRWIRTIRALRRMLRDMRDNKIISVSEYRKLYSWASAGRFKSKSYLKMYIDKMKEQKR